MPDRELRRMSRTELVEIIFALKQSEDQLKAENDALKAQLADRQIRIENAGSIAQAALELNRVFEAAQAAADEYLASVRTSSPKPDAISDALREQARAEARQILAQAKADADALKAQTQQECRAMAEECERRRSQTEADCKALVAKTQQDVQARWAEFDRRASEVLDGYHKADFLPESGAGQ